MSIPFCAPTHHALAVRAWIIDGGDADAVVDETPLWVLSLQNGTDDGVAELLAAGADPNRRTADGRGWLHWATLTRAPDWITQMGFSLLGEGWWRPDNTGISAFHLPTLSPSVAQSMAARWWAEGLDWSILDVPETPESAAARAGAQPLARVWRGWRKVLSAH